jgi:hypothetical protein
MAHVVIMVDYFTKPAEFAVIQSKTPAAVAKALNDTCLRRYFVPSHVTGRDNGTDSRQGLCVSPARFGIK